MKPAPQCPDAWHPVPLAVEVPTQTADPQHRLADRRLRWFHPFPKSADQHLNLILVQDPQRRCLREIRGKSGPEEILCQFIILARKDEPTPDYAPDYAGAACGRGCMEKMRSRPSYRL